MSIHEQLTAEQYKDFPNVVDPITAGAEEGVQPIKEGMNYLVMLDRYSLRDNQLKTLKAGDIVVAELKPDPKYPTQGYGILKNVNPFTGDLTLDVKFPETVTDNKDNPMDLSNFVVKRDKAFKPLETHWEQICYRVSKGVASVEKTPKLQKFWFKKFYDMLLNLYAIPGGRILYGAGSDNNVTLFNCFVLNYIKDSRKGIAHHRELTMEIMSRGGGVGSNGSTLRPRDAYVAGVNGKSSGSVSWLGDLANLTDLVQQGGSRRGAQMIGLADWHPDLITFVLCKIQNYKILDKITKEIKNPQIVAVAESLLKRDEDGKAIGVHKADFMTGANISVLISDDFMKQVEAKGKWKLRFPDLENFTPEQKEIYDTEWEEMGDVRKWEAKGLPTKVYAEYDAAELWDLLNIASRYSAEPGMIFIDHCNNESNAWYYAPLVVTNPCGEQPLPKNAVCNLIAINLAKMADEKTGKVNYELLTEVTRVTQRFADNVIDHSYYFYDENKKMAYAERRVGKGVMGLGDLMIKLELPYGSEDMLEETDHIFDVIKTESYRESARIAKEKGSFPLYNEEKFLQSGFMKRMDAETIRLIKENGIRNVCSLTVAPTGSTGTMVGVSTGLEPYFSFTYFRSGRLGQFIEVKVDIAQEYMDAHPEATELPDFFVSAMQLSPIAHARVQATIQRHVDSAISKTCNAPSEFSVEDNKELYLSAWKMGCKGVTVYVDGSRDSQVLSLTAEENSFEESEKEQPITVEETKAEEVKATPESEEDLMMDTRVCTIRYENGNQIRECH